MAMWKKTFALQENCIIGELKGFRYFRDYEDTVFASHVKHLFFSPNKNHQNNSFESSKMIDVGNKIMKIFEFLNL